MRVMDQSLEFLVFILPNVTFSKHNFGTLQAYQAIIRLANTKYTCLICIEDVLVKKKAKKNSYDSSKGQNTAYHENLTF